ncbi:hypothetical protein [Streptosporangium amethystogenes]|uniref:hypothetical protein n=1 Tax=Streptosporangium amethystogenes TaxID=2002 RepID=UPI0004CB89FA|nr:hypothetical protein [Streptosporangium amethystogenes]
MSYPIGQLAGLSGLPVKTIRFRSDIGGFPNAAALGAATAYRGRLEPVRALCEIGVDLATVRSLPSDAGSRWPRSTAPPGRRIS